MREPQRGVEHVGGRDDAVDQAPTQCGCSVDALTQQQHLHRGRVRNVLHEPLRPTGGREDAVAHLGRTELGVFGGDTQVRGEQQREPAAQAIPPDRRHHRFPQIEAAIGAQLDTRIQQIPQWVRAGQEVAQVGAGAKRTLACTGEHD